MSLGRVDLEQVSEADLLSLIDTGVPEGISIDYKLSTYGRSDADIKEFLKDVSSFANTLGGHLAIGIAEKDGIASAIVPLTGVEPDKELQRLENLMRDGLEPRVLGARMKAVPISGGGFALVIRVPKSWNPPHRVSARNTNRFYVRNSAGAHEVSVDELRALFNLSASVHDRVRAFRQERLAKVSSGETPIALANAAGKLLLHIVPFSAFSGQIYIDLTRAEQYFDRLLPLASSSEFSWRYNFDGCMTFRGGEQCFGYTQLFRNGCIEATKSRLMMERDGRFSIPSLDFDQNIMKVLPLYISALEALDVAPPLILMISLLGVRDATLGVEQGTGFFNEPVPIAQSVLELPEIVIESYGSPEDYQKAVRPAFDALWNAAGFAASTHFDSDGRWRPPPGLR